MKAAIETLLESGEGQFIEFKSCYDRTANKPARKRLAKYVARDIAICLAEFAKQEIKKLIEYDGVEMIGLRKGAKYYPMIQRGTLEEKLREYFSRHEFLTNFEYRRLFGKMHPVTASIQLN